jgi:hypothetical protein
MLAASRAATHATYAPCTPAPGGLVLGSSAIFIVVAATCLLSAAALAVMRRGEG